MKEKHKAVEVLTESPDDAFKNLGPNIIERIMIESRNGYRLISSVPIITNYKGIDDKPEEVYNSSVVLVFELM